MARIRLQRRKEVAVGVICPAGTHSLQSLASNGYAEDEGDGPCHYQSQNAMVSPEATIHLKYR